MTRGRFFPYYRGMKRISTGTGRVGEKGAGGWSIRPARNGRPALVSPDGRWMESRFRPDVGAQRCLEAFSDAFSPIKDRTVVVVIGPGGGEILRAARKFFGRKVRIIGVFPMSEHWEAFVAAKSSRDLLEDSGIRFLFFGKEASFVRTGAAVWGTADPSEFLRSLADAARGAIVIPYIVSPCPEPLEDLERLLEDFDLRRRTALRFSALMEENRAANEKRFLSAPGIERWKNRWKGEEVVVAGGGPSLDEIDLQRFSNLPWIAVGTALKPLLARRVQPELCVITDPQDEVLEQISGVPPEEIPPTIVFPTTCRNVVHLIPEIVPAYPEGEEAFSESEEESSKATSNPRNAAAKDAAAVRKGELPAFGTVAGTALGAAVLTGARRVYLAGIDFAFPADDPLRTHSRGTAREERRIFLLDRFSSIETDRLNSALRGGNEDSGERLLSVAGISVVAPENLRLYARAVERFVARHPEVEFVQIGRFAVPLRGVKTVL
ncbi:MAG: DUF115 domain-containing protein [Candidatus Hydrogenedentota bacterium]|nr:MAG: DUF115 domain-containing protein [Candidatus Hydrogenedentota bacterium]